MKKILFVLLTIFLILPFSACGKKLQDTKLTIVCTGYSQYDWAVQILGEHRDDWNLKYLLDTGVDLHNYALSVNDRLIINNADLFIYAGGESDEWVEDILPGSKSGQVAISMVHSLDEPLGEEWGDNIFQEPEEEHGDDHEEEYDEHVWLSIKNAKELVVVICNAIRTIDPTNSADYLANAMAYIGQLNTLDDEYTTAISNATIRENGKPVLVFADRFPFLYLTNDYGIEYYSAFHGCSSTTEVTPAVIAGLENKINELHLPYIIEIEGNKNHSLPQTIKAETGANILLLNSLQSVASVDINGGLSYIVVMRANLETLKIALGV